MAVDNSNLRVLRDDQPIQNRLTGGFVTLVSIAFLAASAFIASRHRDDSGGVIFGLAFVLFCCLLIWGLALLFKRCERHIIDCGRRELTLEVWGVFSPSVRRIPARDIREITLLTSRNRQDDGYDSITKTENFIAVWLRDGEMIRIGACEESSTADMPPSAALNEMRMRVCEALAVQAGTGSLTSVGQDQATPVAIDHDSVRLEHQYNRLVRIERPAQLIELRSHPENAVQQRLLIGAFTLVLLVPFLPPIFGIVDWLGWFVFALMVIGVFAFSGGFSSVDEEIMTIDGAARTVAQRKRRFYFGHERYTERTIAFADIAVIAQGTPSKGNPSASGTIKHHLPYWVSPVSLQLKSGEAIPIFTRGWYATAATAPDPLLAVLREMLPDVSVVRIPNEEQKGPAPL